MIRGRIVKGVGGTYEVVTESGIYICKARGIFRKNDVSPVVGDICEVDILDGQKKDGNIVSIGERKNEFIRPKVCNVDQVMIVFAAKNPNINLDLLDRFLIVLESSPKRHTFEVTFCINKTDLDDVKEASEIRNIYESIGYHVLTTSAHQGIGINELRESITNKVTVLSGPSGVGKSTLINLLAGENLMETGSLSEKIGRGKHTTRHVELFNLSGGFIIDTPGFASLFIDSIRKDELKFLFREFQQFEGTCRFTDCMHINEPDCAVKAQVGRKIHKKRYDNYLKFYEGTEGIV